jgi:hypothetical protein
MGRHIFPFSLWDFYVYVPLLAQRRSSDNRGCTVIHIVQVLRFRLWWLIPTAICCGILELTGWGGRLWSSHNPYLETPFVIACVYCTPPEVCG